MANKAGTASAFSSWNTALLRCGRGRFVVKMLDLRRAHYGDGVVAVDCGANIGVHTVEWAKRMTGWGVVLAFEAQERIYYALAGNIAINNCFNARAIHAAVTSRPGTMKMPIRIISFPQVLAVSNSGSARTPSLSARRSTIPKARWSTCRLSVLICSIFLASI